ncbi:MAG: NAD-dependent epimerase/dehydratase family protein [Myxococcota bacterium]
MSEVHTVFGAGQIGTLLATQLAQAGHRVRLVRRGPARAAIPGVTWMQGDATDAAFAAEACRGATTVYNCTNPPDYARWDGLLQPLFRSIWKAAADAEARLVQLDNLYMLGRPPSAPFDESTPMNPCSHKGALRKAMAEELMEMHAQGRLEACVGRASDFFGPDTPNTAVMRPDVLKRLHQGGSVYLFGNPDMPHSYSYAPDVARGLATLGTHPDAPGRTWHLPVSAQRTTRELLEAFAAHSGVKIKVRRVPQWLMRTIGVFVPLFAAVAEMAYQWDVPYLVDDRAFRTTFGIEPTPLPQAIETTLASTRPEAAPATARTVS